MHYTTKHTVWNPTMHCTWLDFECFYAILHSKWKIIRPIYFHVDERKCHDHVTTMTTCYLLSFKKRKGLYTAKYSLCNNLVFRSILNCFHSKTLIKLVWKISILHKTFANNTQFSIPSHIINYLWTIQELILWTIQWGVLILYQIILITDNEIGLLVRRVIKSHDLPGLHDNG